MAGGGPPIPPPEPFRQGPGPRAPPPRPGGGGPPGPPPPPPGHPFQMPIRQPFNSTRLSDISHRTPLDDAACLKKLTTYDAYTIRKVPVDTKEKPTWARAEITLESWSQEEILKQIRRLNERRVTVAEKKQALANYQQGQVTSVMDQLKTTETDGNFEWTLVQLDSEKKTLGKDRKDKKTLKETTTITVYVKRAPRKDLNPSGLFNAIERMKIEKMNQMGKPPPQNGGGGGGGGGGGDGGGGGGGDNKLPPGVQMISKPPKPKPDGRKGHSRRDDRSSSSSAYSHSDSDGFSDYSSETDLDSMSTRSDRHSRRHSHHGRNRSRGHDDRRRDHRKKYYLDDRVVVEVAPEPRLRDPYPPRVYVPDVPHADPVAAAYKAGQADANAQIFGVTERYPAPRPLIEPRAIVSYGRPDHVYDRIPEPRGPRYHDERYVDDFRAREDDLLRREREDEQREELRRRERDVEEYIDRRPIGPYMERRPSEPPRIIYTNPNPFAPAPLPRRYPPGSPTHTSFSRS
jgi:hypothetical protein